MAIEIRGRKVGMRVATATGVALPPGEAVLPRATRINLSLRRRRLRRVQQALGTAAWLAGGVALLFFTMAGILSLH
jgi:hypothetical protein